MSQREIVVKFNITLKEFFTELLEVIFTQKEKIDLLARSQINKALRLLKINKNTDYFIKYWIKNMPQEYKKPIKDRDNNFFLNNIEKKEDSNTIFPLLKIKGQNTSNNNKNIIFVYLNVLLHLAELY